MRVAFRSAASALHYVLLVGGGIVLLVMALGEAPLVAWVALACGWIAASFSEYAVHRYLMHGRRFIARVHAAHHAMPDFDQVDFVSYFGPIVVAALGWAAVAVCASVSGMSASLAAAHAFAAGLGFGYSYFRAVHRLMHLARTPRLIAGLSRFHDSHHHSQAGNFGVTTRLWDHLFGSVLPEAAPPGDPQAVNAR